MLDVEKISFKYKKKHVFEDFSLSLEKGKVYGLLGKNGSGKSTLLYLMTGLLLPQKGIIEFNGENVSKRRPVSLKDIFIVPEEFSLPNISLKKYLSVNAPFYPNFSHKQLEENLKHFELDMDVNLGALSMGQKKKVFMCFALATNTPLLIMDEPTNGLDIPGKSQFKKSIVSNMTDDRAIIISTHQVQDVDKLIEQIIILENNETLLNASVNDICKKLYFVNGVTDIDLNEALYASPTLQGYNALYPNPANEETILNMETLFNAFLDNPELLKNIFKGEG